jgi:hypothetical protein
MLPSFVSAPRGGTLMVDYGSPGVIWLMIGLLVVQNIAVYSWGVEPVRRIAARARSATQS